MLYPSAGGSREVERDEERGKKSVVVRLHIERPDAISPGLPEKRVTGGGGGRRKSFRHSLL